VLLLQTNLNDQLAIIRHHRDERGFQGEVSVEQPLPLGLFTSCQMPKWSEPTPGKCGQPKTGQQQLLRKGCDAPKPCASV